MIRLSALRNSRFILVMSLLLLIVVGLSVLSGYHHHDADGSIHFGIEVCDNCHECESNPFDCHDNLCHQHGYCAFHIDNFIADFKQYAFLILWLGTGLLAADTDVLCPADCGVKLKSQNLSLYSIEHARLFSLRSPPYSIN